MKEIYKAEIKAPVKEGQLILKNPAKCGANVVATLELKKVGND
jgi:CxxC motif-containing protein